ncbi:MAG: multinuclear nonheme iron-dependent oxidase, partial [Nitrospirales bacterium]
MTWADECFQRRVDGVPHHGLGLSVDLYTPDLFQVMQALRDADLACGYLEVFKAPQPALATVRQAFPALAFAYHGEGLWMTQPDLDRDYPLEAEVQLAADHVRTLQSAWINHECAAKEIAGYSFGTYLPPLFTPASADLTARNAVLIQGKLDEAWPWPEGAGPLLLLEVPPLTYVGFGTLSLAPFFRRITEAAPCGLVLDMGHLWTFYRYAEDWRARSLSDFLDEFLDTFPLERVVEIHVAGLAPHEGRPDGSVGDAFGCGRSEDGFRVGDLWWIDAHGAPIPPVLFEMLEQVLAHPRLQQLKGLALEVDTKAIDLIVREFKAFQGRC